MYVHANICTKSGQYSKTESRWDRIMKKEGKNSRDTIPYNIQEA